MTTEANLWQWLRKANKRGEVKLQRLENRIGAGMPDVIGYVKGVGAVYLELKAGKMPARETSKIPAEPLKISQQLWFEEMTGVGCGTHYILLKLSNELYLIPGGYWRDYLNFTVKDLWPWRVNCIDASDLIKNYL